MRWCASSGIDSGFVRAAAILWVWTPDRASCAKGRIQRAHSTTWWVGVSVRMDGEIEWMGTTDKIALTAVLASSQKSARSWSYKQSPPHIKKTSTSSMLIRRYMVRKLFGKVYYNWVGTSNEQLDIFQKSMLTWCTFCVCMPTRQTHGWQGNRICSWTSFRRIYEKSILWSTKQCFPEMVVWTGGAGRCGCAENVYASPSRSTVTLR